MQNKLSRQMSLLGLGVLAFYASLLATGQASIEIMPQFVISAVIFLSSGRIMRQMAARLPGKEKNETKAEPDWEHRTLVLNWVAAGTVVGIVALFIAKPIGMTFPEFFEVIMYANYHPELEIPLAP